MVYIFFITAGAREGGKPAAVAKAQRAAKKGTQKGKTRHFTSPEELAAQAAQLDLEREGGEPVWLLAVCATI